MTKTISVVGLGYIGLPTAAIFASRGINVVGVDVNTDVIDTINQGDIHIVEPGLSSLVETAVRSGCLRATLSPEPAEAFLIAVPTPFKGDNYEPDLSYIKLAVESIAPVLEKGCLIILESTSPVSTTEKMAEWLSECRSDLTFPHTHGEESDIRIAYCPERVLPGNAINELVENDRIVGGLTQACSKQAEALYKLVVKGDCMITNSRTAEMAKLTENTFRDINIAFANELSIICDAADINVRELISLANKHPRVNILQPGCGVGGHCIAVDPWFLVHQFKDEARLIALSRDVNDQKPLYVVDQVRRLINNGSDISIACMGLTFKPDVDDFRGSPALQIAKTLSEVTNGSIYLCDPYVEDFADLSLNEQFVFSDVNAAIDQADIVLVLVKHTAFVDPEIINALQNKKVIDVVGLME